MELVESVGTSTEEEEEEEEAGIFEVNTAS